MALNETHDPHLQSWIASANVFGNDFPLQNLPFAIFRRSGGSEPYRAGVAIGDQILDLAAALKTGALGHAHANAAWARADSSLNQLMAAGSDVWSSLRLALSRALRAGAQQQVALRDCLLAQAQAQFALPASIGDYTDFYTSLYHATAVGRLLRPDNPLLPNYKWLPIGYHGRCSSIAISGQQFVRPSGQRPSSGGAAPTLGPSRRLDYELELGAFVGPGNALGDPIGMAQAESQIFGLCLLNDWSARDLQAWEYQPLGPFLGKNFASTISPWIVTYEALEPFRVGWSRPADDPQPLAYLDSPTLRSRGALDIRLETYIETDLMRKNGLAAHRLAGTSFRHAFWTLAQMLAHHTVNGCNLRPGDLIGTGTQSGPEPSEAGSLLELSMGGKQPFKLSDGQERTFLEDGDAIIMRGWCEREGAARIGFGEVVGRVLPARA